MTQHDTAAAKAHTAPPPDADRKPDSPGDIDRPGWRYTAKASVAEFQRDQCTDLAAALTYYSVLSVFPAILALVSLLGVFGQGEATTQALLEILRDLGQSDIADQLEKPIAAMVEAQSAGLALAVGLAGALWGASGYVGAFGRTLNRIYQVDEGRPVWKLRPLVLLVTVG
ncbi:MAG TPA: YihY/virulence factor BrkB family protein, partial [Ornithinibacter sp.]|nr:YihY/virulence factor BrkB family protein [Ornithinibacter sp.]